ncbi:hypothetical protein ACFX1R_042046 [Malus domestica]
MRWLSCLFYVFRGTRFPFSLATNWKSIAYSGGTVHWYDKPEMRKQWHMSHITIVGPSLGNVEKLLESVL